MYFSYVPSIIFSFFNRPLFLNLLFKQILIQYYSFVSLVSMGGFGAVDHWVQQMRNAQARDGTLLDAA